MGARRILGWVTLLGVAGAGAALGTLVAAPTAQACKCAPNKWLVRLRTASSTEPGVSHGAHWPVEAELSGHDRAVSIWATRYEPGVIWRAGAHE